MQSNLPKYWPHIGIFYEIALNPGYLGKVETREENLGNFKRLYRVVAQMRGIKRTIKWKHLPHSAFPPMCINKSNRHQSLAQSQ